MLYYFLLDDVARKQPKKADGKEAELVESPTGEMVPSTKGILRTRSEKHAKRKKAPGFPMKKLKARVMDEDESLPSSPQLPAESFDDVIRAWLAHFMDTFSPFG